MSRINGFKNLDELLPKSVDELIKQGIIKDDSYSFDKLLYNIKLNDSNYYFKECPYQEAIIELIVNEILDKLKIKNVKYDLAYLNGHYGVISKDFKKQGKKYTEGNEIIEEYINNLPGEIISQEDGEFKQILQEEYMKFRGSGILAGYTKNNFELIWNAIESHFKNFDNKHEIVSKLMTQLATTHLLDILLSNADRNKSNWAIEEDDTQANLVPIFDNGEAFKDGEWMALRVAPLSTEEIDNNIYTELEQFLKRSDSFYYNFFMELKDQINIGTLIDAMASVEKKIGVNIDDKTKNDILISYQEHLKKLDKVLKGDKIAEAEER